MNLRAFLLFAVAALAASCSLLVAPAAATSVSAAASTAAQYDIGNDSDALTTQQGLRTALTKDMYSFFTETMPHPFITNDNNRDALDVDDPEISARGDALAKSAGFVNLEDAVYALQASLRDAGLLPAAAGTANTLHGHLSSAPLGQVCAKDVLRYCKTESDELQFVAVSECLQRNQQHLSRNCRREFSSSLASKCASDMRQFCTPLMHLRTLGDVFIQEVVLADCFDANHAKLEPTCVRALARAVRPPVIVSTMDLHDKAPKYVDNVQSHLDEHNNDVRSGRDTRTRPAVAPAAAEETTLHSFNPLPKIFSALEMGDSAGVLPGAEEERKDRRGRKVALFLIFVLVAFAAVAAVLANCFPHTPAGRIVRSVFCSRASGGKGGSFAGRLMVPTNDDQYADDFTDAHYDL